MSERRRLLNNVLTDTQVHNHYRGCHIILSLLCIFFTLPVLILFSFLVINWYNFTHLGTPLCQNGTLQTTIQTRSGSITLLANISEGTTTCTQPIVNFTLHTPGSSIKVIQDLCKNIAMQRFTDEGSEDNVSFTNNPYPVFDDDFLESNSPRNYFINGTIQVTMTNITTSLFLDANVSVCLFTDNVKYRNFVDSGTEWKSHIENNVECHAISVSSGQNYTILLNISKPTYAFVGIASPQLINIFHLKFNATGFNISRFNDNSTSSLCHLNDENKSCYRHLLTTPQNDKNICIVAYEEGTDISYDYSYVAYTLPTPSKPYNIDPFIGSGLGFLGTFIIAVVLSAICVYCVCCKRTRSQHRSPSSPEEDNTDADTDDPPRSTTTENPTTQAAIVTAEDTTGRGALVVTSPSQPPKVESEVETAYQLPKSTNTPIQESRQSPTRRPTQDVDLPIQENVTNFSSAVVDYRREGDTEPVFDTPIQAEIGREQ